MTYTIWDKTSPVNGVSAQRMMQIKGFSASDEIYLLQSEDGTTHVIESDRTTPFPADTIEESAELHLAAMEKPVPPPAETFEEYRELVDALEGVMSE